MRAFEENDYETLLQNSFTATAAADLTTKHVETDSKCVDIVYYSKFFTHSMTLFNFMRVLSQIARL